MSVYDKAVEYISGGSNVPDIRAYFWRWRRFHRLQTRDSAAGDSYPVVPKGAKAMRRLEGFGVDNLNLREQLEGMSTLRRVKSEAAFANNSVEEAAPAEAARAEATAPASRVQVELRSSFADTALWRGSLDLPPDGTATVEFKAPDDLTTWRIRSWAISSGTRVGESTGEIVTTKPILIRPETPRFLIEGDQVVLSGVVHNYLPTKQEITVQFSEQSALLELLGESQKVVELEPNTDSRVDWTVRAKREGTTRLRMTATTETASDGVEIAVPVYVHGALLTESVSRVMRPDQRTLNFSFDVPARRREEQSAIELRFSPSLALAMVDALPYLTNFPYGCTEQTLNRFLPT
jgi:uncharacterized protein YfaS (alpha-2-macroglobulin family)